MWYLQCEISEAGHLKWSAFFIGPLILMKHAMLFVPERLSQLGWKKSKVKAGERSSSVAEENADHPERSALNQSDNIKQCVWSDSESEPKKEYSYYIAMISLVFPGASKDSYWHISWTTTTILILIAPNNRRDINSCASLIIMIGIESPISSILI